MEHLLFRFQFPRFFVSRLPESVEGVARQLRCQILRIIGCWLAECCPVQHSTNVFDGTEELHSRIDWGPIGARGTGTTATCFTAKKVAAGKNHRVFSQLLQANCAFSSICFRSPSASGVNRRFHLCQPSHLQLV